MSAPGERKVQEAPPCEPKAGERTGARRPPRAIALAAVLGGIALVTLLLAFGLSRDPSQLRSNLEGRPAPDFTLRSLDASRSVHLADLKGQVVVINFWASWCAECRIEDPELEAAWERYRDQRVVFLGISFQDTTGASQAYAADHHLTWPLLSDPASNTALAYGISGVPETIFIGADGRVASKRIGPVSYRLLNERIGRLLQEQAP